jgi:PEP-CTERM motif
MRIPLSAGQLGPGLLAFSFLISVGAAQADTAPIPVPPPSSGSTTYTLGGVTDASDPALGGTVIYDQLQPYDFTGGGGQIATGEVQVRVVQEAGTGTLDFYWDIRSSANSDANITAFDIGGFGGGPFNADYRTDGLGSVGPNEVQVFGGSNLGNVNFLFNTPVAPGEDSYLFFLQTTATTFSATGFYDLLCTGLCMSPKYIAQAPGSAAVPEPATLALMGLGLAGVFMRRRRKN